MARKWLLLAGGSLPSFPITGHDGLTANQMVGRLGTLTPAERRKVRDHERRNASRKTVVTLESAR